MTFFYFNNRITCALNNVIALSYYNENNIFDYITHT